MLNTCYNGMPAVCGTHTTAGTAALPQTVNQPYNKVQLQQKQGVDFKSGPWKQYGRAVCATADSTSSREEKKN